MNIARYSQGTVSASEFLRRLRRYPHQYWVERGEKMALTLFHKMANRVPAYKDFLRKNHIRQEKIKTITDLFYVPPLDKNNYLRSYPREMLCWDGVFANKQWVVAATSGSTGEPFYFPREYRHDLQYAVTAELYLRTNFEIHKRSTLYIIGFPMGVWIGGVFTYEALKIISERSQYRLSIITPGINKYEIIKAVKNLGSDFDQILIGSYAPFLKDILDDGVNHGVDWKKYNLGFIFSAEAFSETFRDYVVHKAGIKNIYKATLNHYGTVDLGTMSHETPLSILVRRAAVNNHTLYQKIFPSTSKLPTLTQYNPEHFFFEEANGNLFCSAPSGIPLVRYDLKDHGGVYGLPSLIEKCSSVGFDVYTEAAKVGIRDTLWNLPFVYVYERSDFSVSFFAFQIYPETIKKALLHSEIQDEVTGKFTMMVPYDAEGNQQFEVHIELKERAKKSDTLYKSVQEVIVRRLIEENSEFRKTHEEYGKRVFPSIQFWPYEDPLYFKPGTKQKWVKK